MQQKPMEIPTGRLLSSPRFVLLLCLIPFLGHLPELIGLVDTNPLLFVSDMPLHPESGLLGGRPFIDGDAGLTTMTLGKLAADSWLNGQLPWWNPYSGVGLPLAAEMQPAAFLLPFVLLLHFAHGVLYLKIALQIFAGLTMLGFLGALGLSGWAAVLGSALFQLNGTFAWYADAPSLPIAFMPLLLWGLERTRTLALQGRRGGEALIALAIAGSLVAGFPEVAFVDGLLGLGWAVMRLCSLPRAIRWLFARRVAVGGVAGLALSAPAVLPFLISLPVSSLGPHGISVDAHLGLAHAATLLFPYVFGPILSDLDLPFWAKCGGYLGAAAPLLALCALVRTGLVPRSMRLFLGAWMVALLAAMFHLPIATQLVRAIPGVQLVFLCRYGMPSVEMAACTLAALALNDYISAPAYKVPRAAAIGWAVAAGFSLGLAAPRFLAIFRVGHPTIPFTLTSIAWAACSAAALTLMLRLPRPHAYHRAIGTLVVIDALALFLTATLSGLTDARIADASIVFLKEHQGTYRAFSIDDLLFPNYGAILKLDTIAYVYIPVPLIWSDYVHAHLDPAAIPGMFPSLGETSWDQALLVSDRYRAFAAIGVRYIAAPSAVHLFTLTGAGGPQRVYHDDRTDIFELPNAKPYVEAPNGNCNIVASERTIMHASCKSPARLVRRELFYPGWHARVNGHRAGIMMQEGLFQAIDLPSGTSEIEWRYSPPFSRTMWLLFFGGSLTLGLLSAAEFADRRRAG